MHVLVVGSWATEVALREQGEKIQAQTAPATPAQDKFTSYPTPAPLPP